MLLDFFCFHVGKPLIPILAISSRLLVLRGVNKPRDTGSWVEE